MAQLVRAPDLHSEEGPGSKPGWISAKYHGDWVTSIHMDTWTNQFVKTFSHKTYLKVSWSNQVTQGRTMYGEWHYARLKWQILCVFTPPYPFRAGMTFPTALAAPVLAGITFWAAPRPSRHFYSEKQ